MRGTFANVRLRNLLAPGTEGGVTLHLPDGAETSIYDAAMHYADEGVPLIVLAGREYGTGVEPRLGGQGDGAPRRARRHRPELRAHPPLQPHRHGRRCRCSSTRATRSQSLGLTGHERFSIAGLDVLNKGELPKELTVTATADDDSVTEFRVIVRIDTPMEAEYYRHGGILQYVLRQMAG